MRLFVAIDVPAEVKDHLTELQRSLGHIPGTRWVQPASAHITLNFLGEEFTPQEATALLKTVSFEPCAVITSSLEFLPQGQRPRIMWLSIEENTALSELQRSIDVLFTPKESYKPHVTVARMKKMTFQNIRKLTSQAAKCNQKQLHIPITSFKLYSSTLTSLGPIYEVLETFEAR